MSLKDQQMQELEAQSADVEHTKRIIAPALEDILYQPIEALDKGFVRVVDYMGSDESIVQAARVSYGKGTKKVSEDRGLIRYLLRHRHTTPFEMCEIKLHVKLPIFIARQWIRHRTANVNEYSARYSILEDEFYVPELRHMSAQSATNRQGRGETLSPERARAVQDALIRDANQCYDTYRDFLNLNTSDQTEKSENGEGTEPPLARELARMNLTLNYYTEWYWKIDLHNFMHFVALRGDPHAQWEIQVYAHILRDILKRWAPMAYEAFVDYRQNAVQLSSRALDVIKRKLQGEPVLPQTSGLSKREWDELMAILDAPPKR
jgi:thymidylate synthase (FAD)